MKIKFNHIQDLSDARYAAAVMAEWIGFAIDGSFSITPEKIQQIIGWCSGPKIILEVYGDPNPLKIKSWFDVLPIDGIECESQHYTTLREIFHQPNLEWIVRGSESLADTLSHNQIFDPKENHIINIQNLSKETSDWLLNHQPFAFSVNCEPELELGKKDFELLNDFFENLEIL